MVTALLGVPVVAFAAACGIAVYRTGQARSVVRALVTFGILLVTPGIAFGLFSVGLTSELPLIVAAFPIALLGIGLYVVAEGSLPSVVRRPAE